MGQIQQQLSSDYFKDYPRIIFLNTMGQIQQQLSSNYQTIFI